MSTSRPKAPNDAPARAPEDTEDEKRPMIPTGQTREKYGLRYTKQEPDRMILNMGPQHPSTHGVLRVIVEFEGEEVKRADPNIGYLHRNFEKISESLTYPQITPFSDRNDYAGPVSNELAYVRAVEKLMEIEIPRRAQYIRIIMGELNRIASHLLWFGAFGNDLGAVSPFLYSFRERELVYDLWEHISGSRMLPGFLRIGGVRNDMPSEWPDMLLDFCSMILEYSIPEYSDLLLNNGIYRRRAEGVGYMSAEEAIEYGCGGPILRASGVDWDLRRDDPVLPYDEFDWKVAVREEGDVNARAWVRMEEMAESAKIIRQAVEQLPEGDVMGDVPRRIRPPEGDIYTHYEGPKGEVGVYLVSDGSNNPFRLKLRSPGFVHLQTVQLMAPDALIADLVAVLGSLDLVMGEVDR